MKKRTFSRKTFFFCFFRGGELIVENTLEREKTLLKLQSRYWKVFFFDEKESDSHLEIVSKSAGN